MKKLYLLFTKDGLQYQISKGKNVQEENGYFLTEENLKIDISEQLDMILQKDFSEIYVVSALNHFTMMPKGFSAHETGFQLISYNANVDEKTEELMLSVNKKYDVQFYYAFPKNFYHKIKSLNTRTLFNFSGEKFLNSISLKGNKEIHINLYHHQCEFFAFDRKKIILYNNLDITSEIDFLYFIMFTLSKIDFKIQSTQFFVYGETTENDTFISELRKFVKKMKIVFDNIPQQNFILNKF